MARVFVLIAALLVTACAGEAPCGLEWDGVDPELGTLVLSDGTVLSNGTWAATRINAGTFTFDLRPMGEEPSLGDALSGELPACRTLDDQNDAIIYQDNGPWRTDASHTGTLAISEFSSDEVKGIFEVTLVSTTGESRSLTGAFYVPAQ